MLRCVKCGEQFAQDHLFVHLRSHPGKGLEIIEVCLDTKLVYDLVQVQMEQNVHQHLQRLREFGIDVRMLPRLVGAQLLRSDQVVECQFVSIEKSWLNDLLLQRRPGLRSFREHMFDRAIGVFRRLYDLFN